jgi:hypothetical protein
MSFDEYKIKKIDNLEFNWNSYLEMHTDIKNDNFALRNLLCNTINNNIKYNDNNIDLVDKWLNINKYIKHNGYIHKDVAFIITTCVRNMNHLHYLKECIRHIRILYPLFHIYVINDNSVISIDEIKGNNIDIIESIAKGGGEINPYLFILDKRCKHDKLVYIHDTVCIKKNIDYFINRTEDINFIWYDNCSINNDTIREENKNILNNLFFYFSNTKVSIYNYIIMLKYSGIPYNVKFGCMSVFTKQFMIKVDLVTNLIQASELFINRINRSFFERILSIIHVFIYGADYNCRFTLCGNIMNHPKRFTNTNTNIVSNMPLVKMWQGR